MSNGINLIATKNRSFLDPLLNRIKVLRLIAVTLLFIVSVASMILFILITLSPLPALKRQEQTSLAALAAYHTDIARLIILNERATSIAGILGKRTDYNTVIDALRTKLTGDSSIISLQLGKKNVSVTVSSSSLVNINNFLNGIVSDTGVKKTFLHSTLNNLSLDKTRGVYLLVLDLTTP